VSKDERVIQENQRFRKALELIADDEWTIEKEAGFDYRVSVAKRTLKEAIPMNEQQFCDVCEGSGLIDLDWNKQAECKECEGTGEKEA
jgi:hypothetical protein